MSNNLDIKGDLYIKFQNIFEKKMLLICYDKTIEIYNIDNNKFENILYYHVEKPIVDIHKINCELFVIQSRKFCNYIYFLEIEYDSIDEPVKINFQNYEIEYIKFSNINNFCAIEENKIMCFNDIGVFVLSKALDNKFYVEKQICVFFPKIEREIFESFLFWYNPIFSEYMLKKQIFIVLHI